jgi:hypothetical protein
MNTLSLTDIKDCKDNIRLVGLQIYTECQLKSGFVITTSIFNGIWYIVYTTFHQNSIR